MARQAKQPQAEDFRNQEPEVTAQNLDPAFIYEIDITPTIRGRGFVVRTTHDPATRSWLPPSEERRRFFVFHAPEQAPFIMTIDEAVAKNISRDQRVGPMEVAAWQEWMTHNY